MAPRIRILPEQLTNKIAAGEVVERPASVIKELVENSLDSGCGEVIVEIENGGKRLIRVTDDGCGMTREDALMALERHATSKISSDDDLFALSSLGFRGEALPSIASVSRFTLASREQDQIEGTEIYVEGGKIKEVKACGMAGGTVVTVRNLFFNTPARLKFLKSTETEAGHVGELLTRLALSRPEIRFTYVSDGRTVFRTSRSDSQTRIAALLGKTIIQSLYPVEYGVEGTAVIGYVGSPDCSRSSSGSIYTYINGRFIRDKVVQHAVLQAYRNCVERGRYPVAVLFIQVPHGEVDVNVHPTKHEVRFREQGKVHDAICAAVESVLRGTPWIKAAPSPLPLPPRPAPGTGVAAARIAEVRESLAAYQEPLPRTWVGGGSPPPPPVVTVTPVIPAVPVAPAVAPPPLVEVQEPAARGGFFSSLTIIGQFNAAYLLCQDGTDLVIVDQHAAHERVAYERLKLQFGRGSVESQGLLFPETVDLSLREGATLGENLEDLSRLGFEIEQFGGMTWLLKAVPRIAAAADPVRLLKDILEEIEAVGRSRSFGDCVEEVLARLACHSVVRGSRTLGTAEIRALFAQMDDTDFSGTCPHGRPVFCRLSLAEIERMFKRT